MVLLRFRDDHVSWLETEVTIPQAKFEHVDDELVRRTPLDDTAARDARDGRANERTV